MKPTDELWEDLIRGIREYARRRYGGRRAIGMTIHLADASHYEPFPEDTPRPRGRPGPPRWDSGPAPKHLSGFRQVYWPGLGTFTFSGETQQAAVRVLWEAFQAGEPEVPQDRLLRAAGSEGTRLIDLFKGHPALNTLLRVRKGCWRLPALAEDADGGEDAA